MHGPFGRLTGRIALLVSLEHVLIGLGVWAAAAVRSLVDATPFDLSVGQLLWRAALIAGVMQLSLHCCDLYDLRTVSAGRRHLFVGLLRAVGGASIVLAVFYYWIPGLMIARRVFIVASIFVAGLVAAWRLAFEWMSRRLGPVERLLMVGTSEAAVTLAGALVDLRSELGVELVGFVDSDPARIGTTLVNCGVIGTVSDIPRIARQHRVDRVVVSLSDTRGKLSMDDLLGMKLHDGVRFDHLASVYEKYTGKIAVENLRPSWLIFSEGFRKSRRRGGVKRAMDIVLSAAGLALTAPALAAVGLIVRLTSPGPAFYHQRRAGKDGRVFIVHKFRSMAAGAEARTGPVWSTFPDPRVTSVGRFLRRTHLDELPQLWNVLTGEMSLVGPRPERPELVANLTTQIPFYEQRHVVRPGLTGWAQVRHAYGSDIEGSLQKLQYDLFYIKHMSLAFDLFIVLETIKTVLVRRGS
jgi:sugar transferase (PEP-CTERM system associated)